MHAKMQQFQDITQKNSKITVDIVGIYELDAILKKPTTIELKNKFYEICNKYRNQ